MKNKIKILHLITSLNAGGAEMHLLSLVEGLVKKGSYSITVAFLKEVREVRSLVNDFEKLGVKVVNLRMNSLFDISAAIRLYMLTKSEKFDILHTHLFRADMIGGFIGMINKIPVKIASVHNTEQFFQNWFIAFLIKFSYKYFYFNKIIAISNAVGEYVVKHIKISPQKVHRIYYGIDIGRIKKQKTGDIRKELEISEDTPVLGVVARLAPQKGHVYLLDAMSYVSKKFPDVKLLIIGHNDMGLRKTLEKKVEALSIKDHVIFLGYRDDIPSIINALDIFVLPSLWEGFGLVLLEAMVFDKPVVATNIGPIPEVIENGQTGLLVPPEDPESLSEAVITLLENREKASKMGSAGGIRVKELFDINLMINATHELYCELLNGYVKPGCNSKN